MDMIEVRLSVTPDVVIERVTKCHNLLCLFIQLIIT